MLSLTTTSSWTYPSTPLHSSPQHPRTLLSSSKIYPSLPLLSTRISTSPIPLIITHCSNSASSTTLSWSETDQEESGYTEGEDNDEDGEEEQEEDGGNRSASAAAARMGHAPPLRRRRTRYRKQYPGEIKGITEEMRFVAMKLRSRGKRKKSRDKSKASNNKSEDTDEDGKELSASDGEGDAAASLDEDNGDVEEEQNGESWEPSVEGFLKYLVDSKLVFTTIERIVDESSDVSYVYLRKTGLERAECLSKDLEWFSQQGNSIPEPSDPGVTYAKYLVELAEKSPPLFMSHFYNVYFSHIAGGQVIAKKVSQKLLEGRELEFFKWEGNEEELLRGAGEKINMLGEHWTRDEKNKCLKEATKAFRFLGQIVRLIVL